MRSHRSRSDVFPLHAAGDATRCGATPPRARSGECRCQEWHASEDSTKLDSRPRVRDGDLKGVQDTVLVVAMDSATSSSESECGIVRLDAMLWRRPAATSI